MVATDGRRSIRIFISSTFRDMQAEREELVKRVFPQVRRLCEQRGVAWSSLGVEFVVLAVVNTVLLTGYANLVGETGVNRATAWFFGLLLTMIIVLFDRFRSERLARIPPAPDPTPVHEL